MTKYSNEELKNDQAKTEKVMDQKAMKMIRKMTPSMTMFHQARDRKKSLQSKFIQVIKFDGWKNCESNIIVLSLL